MNSFCAIHLLLVAVDFEDRVRLVMILHSKWRISVLRFVQSFRPVAQMVTSIGRSHLLPVVGHSTLTSNVWKLQSTGPAALTFTYQGDLQIL